MKPDSVKRTADEMHYRGVSSTRPSQAPAKPDPLGPIVHRYLLSGDEEAMDRLVAHTRPKLMAVARRIGDPQDAEDAVQGAYMALLRKRGTGLDAPVMPWLLTTVIRLAYRRKAKQRRQRDLAARLAQPREGEAGVLPTVPAAPDRRALDEERDVLIRASVARLPATYRDAVVLRHLEGLTTRETAALLDIPEATLRTRLHRAAKLLRSRMAPALLASLLFLPWCAADAVRRIPPITRPAGVKAAALATGAIVVASASFAWMHDASTASSGSAAHPPAVVGPEQPAPAGGTPATGSAPSAVTPRDDDGRSEPTPDEPRPTRLPAGVGAPGAVPPRPPVNGAVPQDALEPGRSLPPVRPPIVEVAAGRLDLPEPPGMVFLEGGPVTIGTPAHELEQLLAGRPPEIRRLFAYETPRHDIRVPSYWMARYEVTNAQYLRFLQDHVVTHTTKPNSLDTLERLAGRFLAREDAPAQRRQHLGTAAWRQLYEGNRGAIWRAFAGAGRDIVVLREDGAVDLEATAERARREPLPTGLTLTFYRFRPPLHWPGLRPSATQMDHPVRYVSYNDAERMAEWAGMHVPTGPEWEWAARGPEARVFPWGDAWKRDASRANWGAKTTNEHHEPTTLPVDSLPAGRSWCEVNHLCGNVAEWTSSWFQAYPDSDIARGKAEAHPYMGRWVKVIRGGSVADMESLVLRPAARNFVGAGPKAPPYPENRFEWVGFRLAAYQQPGLDHVAPLMRRGAAGHMQPAAFDAARFAAFVQRDWLPADAASPNHVYVRGRTTAVVFVPVTYLLRDEAHPTMAKAWNRPQSFRSTKGLVDKSEGDTPFFTLGVLQLGLPLDGVGVPDPDAKVRKRGGARLPATRPGRCEPGTYLVTLWHGRIVLTTPLREFVCLLPERAPRVPSVEVRPRSSESLGPPTLKPSLEADEGGLDFTVLLGGRRSPDKHVVRARAALPYDPQAFAEAQARGAFLRSTDGR